jgi:hypothetical protein
MQIIVSISGSQQEPYHCTCAQCPGIHIKIFAYLQKYWDAGDGFFQAEIPVSPEPSSLYSAPPFQHRIEMIMKQKMANNDTIW